MIRMVRRDGDDGEPTGSAGHSHLRPRGWCTEGQQLLPPLAHALRILAPSRLPPGVGSLPHFVLTFPQLHPALGARGLAPRRKLSGGELVWAVSASAQKPRDMLLVCVLPPARPGTSGRFFVLSGPPLPTIVK